MDTIDRFIWHMRNVDGVHSVLALPDIAKRVATPPQRGATSSGQRCRLPGDGAGHRPGRHQQRTDQLGLQRHAGAAVLRGPPGHDHRPHRRRGQGIQRAGAEPKVEFKLASGNVGVMAATNEAVDAAEHQMLVALFGSISLMCLAAFRSIPATLCIVLPLGWCPFSATP